MSFPTKKEIEAMGVEELRKEILKQLEYVPDEHMEELYNKVKEVAESEGVDLTDL